MFSFNKIKFSFQKHILCFYETYEYASFHPSNEAGKIIQKTGRYDPSYLQAQTNILVFPQ